MIRACRGGCRTGDCFAPSLAEPNKQILDRAQHYQVDALKLLERLVNIDSGTGYADGLVQVGAIAVEELRQLGADIEILPAKPAVGDNIVATFKGTGKGRILLMAHTDTVFAQGTAAKRPFRIDGERAYGPGVSDDKGGIVTAIAVLKILQDLKFRDYARITLLLNTNEETGSRGSRALIEQLAREHDVTLNLGIRAGRRRHRDLAQGFGAVDDRSEGPRRARRRLAGAGPQRSDGIGQPGAAGRQARQPRRSRRR